MAENKLEEVIDLLAEYGGFDRNYLKDKLLINSSKEKPDNKVTDDTGEESSMLKRCGG